jgi:hypothetical protein
MRYNYELNRQILFKIEERPLGVKAKKLVIEGFSEFEIAEHLRYLRDKGLITGIAVQGDYWPGTLTEIGNKYLDEIRDNSPPHKWKKMIRSFLIKYIQPIFVGIVISLVAGILLFKLGFS